MRATNVALSKCKRLRQLQIWDRIISPSNPALIGEWACGVISQNSVTLQEFNVLSTQEVC